MKDLVKFLLLFAEILTFVKGLHFLITFSWLRGEGAVKQNIIVAIKGGSAGGVVESQLIIAIRLIVLGRV